MSDCLKGKAHEWRLVSDKVVCRLCNARGTLQDLDDEIGSFYALRDERDELQATLDELRASYCMEITRSSNLEAEWDEALRRVVQLEAQLNGMKHNSNNWRHRALAAEERQWAKQWKLAAKKYYGKSIMQDTLADIGHIALLAWKDRTREARAWAIRMRQERDAWQTKANEYCIASERDELQEALDAQKAIAYGVR